jgi:outer membrane receptor protein involved in Fe transport
MIAMRNLVLGCSLLGSMGLAMGAGGATESMATEATRVAFDIESKPLNLALTEFARQSGLQVVFVAELGRDLTAPRVSGSYTPEVALKRLLVNTPFAFDFINPRTVTIRTHKSSGQALMPAPGGTPDAGALKLARVEMPGSGDALEQAGSQAPRLPDSTSGVQVDRRGIPEMLVRDRRTSNVDIRRSEDDVQPYVVYDAETLERSMTVNLEEFLKTRLPMNAIDSTDSQQALLTGNTSSIDLRGLGTDETLVLVNGRRMPGVYNGREFGQADINGIPISAVERVEVLPSTASGIYGGGATGGVVNIILKSDFNALEFATNYDNTFDTDSARRRVDATLGFSAEGGRTSFLLTGSYSDSNPIAVGDRDFVSRAYQLYVDNTGNDFSGGFTPPLSSTTNIQALGFFNPELVLLDPDGGAPVGLGSLIAHVPLGYAGVESDGGAALVATGGSYNIALPTDVQGLQAGIVNNPIVSSFAANIRRTFTDRIEGFADLSWASNEGHVPHGSQSTTFQMFPGFPGNPFDNFVQVTFPLPGLNVDRSFTSETSAATGGAIVRLPGDWLGQAEYTWSRSRNEGYQTSPILSSGILAAINNGVLDVFRDFNAFTPDYSPYLLDSPNNFRGPFDNTRTGATLRLAGPVLELPGGDLALSAFYEHRKSAADAARVRMQDGSTREYFELYHADRSQSVDSLSLEATVPLISGRNARAGVRALDLQAAVRYDQYEVNGVDLGTVRLDSPDDPIPEFARSTAELSSGDYTAGLRYAPTEDLAVRVSFGTGFLPPTVAQVIPTESVSSVRVSDPHRGGVATTLTGINRITGGNPNLDPEESESLSAGVVITPRTLPGLRLSVDFTEIRKTGEISGIDPQIILDPDNEALLGHRVTRGELTEQDMTLDYTAGPIIGIDTSLINLSRTTVRGWDVQLDYLFDTSLGSLRLYALATHVADHLTQLSPSVDPVSHAGHQYRLKWRGNAGATLERQLWSLDWNMQYYHSYLVYLAGLSEGAIQNRIAEQGSDTIPRQTYHDLTARIRLGELAGAASGFLAGTELHLGLKNVFNTSPPIVATALPSNGYSFLGDPRLRRYSITLSKRFR